jgi:protein phosphatase
VKLIVSAASDVGCVRNNNEDMILIGDSYVRNDAKAVEVDIDTETRYLLALADGMGGHNSGEVASQVTLSNLHYFFYDLPTGLSVSDFNEAIYEWLESINAVIDSKGHAEPRFYNMGTTLVALAYFNNEFYWMNCGDSRVYRMSDGILQQVSTDHSLSNLMGESERSSVITNCIGGGCKTSYIDLVNCTKNAVPGTLYMLCSDGLTDMVSDDEIQALLNDGADATRLCDAAIEAGGYDNVSVSIIKIV